MRQSFIVSGLALCLLLLAVSTQAQDKLEGRWEGKLNSQQGERPATATFRKEGAGYSGTITGAREDLALKEIKLDGDRVTAKAEVDAQGNTLVINYNFKLVGEALKGTGALDFNGNAFSFDVDLKRTSAGAAVAPLNAAPAADKLSGRWEGKLNSPQGEFPMWIVFKKEGEDYSGKISGVEPGQESTLKDVKLDGDKLTAKADIEAHGNSFLINYILKLQGEALTGTGALDFNGNAISFDVELKRGANK